ncbi:MAG: hypothetical protein M0R80_11085 [Proteobacteria bacterium]|jgi:hypothetical protein|nr:hypothetical protein [Pseudomonadota bacterium]
MRHIAIGLVFVAVLGLAPDRVAAGEFTDVIDAADQRYNGDPFDLTLRVGYERFYKQGDIRRESFDTTPHEWDYYGYVDVAKYTQTTHILNMELDIGLFHDISLKTRLPLILKDQRKLSRDKDFSWADDFDGDGSPDQLFSTDFKSPDRSGIDVLAVGLWWGILDQGRDDTKPNWTFFVEGRFSVGEEMSAACGSSDAQCSDGYDNEGNATTASSKGGISRGVHEIAGGLRLSRRYGIVEPYFGLEALIGFSKGGANFFIDRNSVGQLNTRPPAVGTIDIGIEFIPWEVPEKERKLVIGVGTGGKYHSEGREFTPLFDALGTSAYFLEQPYVDFNGDGVNNGGEEVSAVEGNAWTGMTDVENYATIFGRVFIAVQPAKYVKFRVGSNFAHETEHFITKTDQCPSDQVFSDGSGCAVYNWGHRPELDKPGNRFRAEKTFIWDFFIDATAQF